MVASCLAVRSASPGSQPDSKARPELAALALRLTQVGAMQGTPAYMAPEQWRGQEAEAAADQFGWSVMAWELLYGERPFEGMTVMTLAANVLAGQRRPPAQGRGVPGWLRRVVERGLASDPRRRWPTMEALLAALGRGLTRSRAWIASTAITGVAAIAAGASYRFAPRETVAVASCRDTPAKPEDVWSAAKRARVERALLATEVDYAEDVWRRVDRGLGEYATAWAAEHAAACEQHLVGMQSSHLLDLRTVCLGRRRSQMSQLIDIFADADAVVVENATQAVAALPSISFCSDVEQLLTAISPPADVHTAERVSYLRARLERATSLETTGLYQASLELASEVRAAAATLGYAPLDAEAALAEGSALLAAGHSGEADAAFVRAIGLALTHDLHTVAAEAAAKRVFVMSEGLSHPSEALVAGMFAEALVERAGDDSRLAALLSNNLAAAHERMGDRAGARARYEHSLALAERGAGDTIEVVIHHNLGGLYVDADELPPARFHYGQALALSGEILGERHPLGSHAMAGIGDVDAREGDAEAAMRNYEASLELMEASYGPKHMYLLHPLTSMGRLHEALGGSDDAVRCYRRAIRIGDGLGLEHPLLSESVQGLARLADAGVLSARAAPACSDDAVEGGIDARARG